MSVNIVITNAGRAALVNAQNTGTLPVVITQVGLSQTAISPSASATILTGEFKRIGGVGGDTVAPDMIHINMTDTTSDAYSLRSFALYLANGTLFAIYGQSTPILEKVAASDALLAIDVVFADISAASLTFGNTNFLNPPATTEKQGVVELATVAEAQAGIDTLRALTPSSAKAAILGWLLSQDGSGSGLDADMLDGIHANAFAQLSGATFGGAINVANGLGASARVDPSGDITANRGNGTGVYYFSGSGTRYLQWDGAQYILAGGNLTINGAVVWNAANDGSGSGLDADMLDGYNSDDFVRRGNNGLQAVEGILRSTNGSGRSDLRPNGDVVAARADGTGVLFLNSGESRYLVWNGTDYIFAGVGAGLQVNGVYVWTPNNDGSGSGLDADMLDGQDGAFYANVLARLGYTPVQQGTGVGQLGNTVKVGWNGSRLKATVDTSDLGNLVFDAQIADVWRASNDGSGSGLDADMLDGFHATEFCRSASLAVDNTPDNSSVQLPTGHILKCVAGAVTGGDSTTQTVTYATPFPNASFVPMVGVWSATGASISADSWFRLISYDQYGCTVEHVKANTGAAVDIPIIHAMGF